MSPHPKNAVAIVPEFGAEMEPRRREALSMAADRMIGEAEMHRLSRRLWTLEIHRRLELQTRRALAS